MSSWLLLLVLFAAYTAALLAAVGEKAIEDAKDPLPNGATRGTSCVPVIPLFPLVMWGVALLIDEVADQWGTWIIGGLHLAMLVFGATSFGASLWRLWRLTRTNKHGDDV